MLEKRLFPELHDLDWMLKNSTRTAQSIAESLGCSPGHVYLMRQVLGISPSSQRITDPEIELLREFFPKYPVEFLAKAMKKSREFLLELAQQLNIPSEKITQNTDECSFWFDWRRFLVRYWDRLQEEDFQPILDFVWAPSSNRTRVCSRCPLLDSCQYSKGPLPCEQLKVRDVWPEGAEL